MNELQQLAEYIAELDYDVLPGQIKESIKYCVLDTVGAALGARKDADMCQITEELLNWSGEAPRMASVWGREVRADVRTATLLNSMAGHALEMDDGHGRAKAHIGVVVVPAACAKLLKLAADQTADALGIAATQSAGLWAFLKEGATLKKLNPARAAVNGLDAALLAKAGMTGPRHALDAPDGGLYRAVSDRFDMREVCLELGERYEILMIEKKLYPSCASTHHAVDAAVEFAARGIKPDEISDVLVECSEVAYIQCGHSEYPKTWVEAKFSIPFTFAAALRDGTLTQNSFCDRMLDDAEVKSLAKKVRCIVNDEFTKNYPAKLRGKVILTLKNGRKMVKDMAGMVGCPEIPLTNEQIQNKFLGLVSSAFDSRKAEKIMQALVDVEHHVLLPSL